MSASSRGRRAANLIRGTQPLRAGKLIVAAATLGGALAATGIAQASSSAGGVRAPAPPDARGVSCIERCVNLRTVARTGRVAISGRNLGSVTSVAFPSANGRVRVAAQQSSPRRVEARVPRAARGGRVIVRNDFGGSATVPERLRVRRANSVASSGPFRVQSAEVTPRKAFFAGRRPTRLSYVFSAQGPTDVRIDMVRPNNGRSIRTLVRRGQQPGTPYTVTWDGLRNNGGVAPNGRYELRVSPLSATFSAADGDEEGAPFRHFDHIFPVRARRVGWGDGLGAGRNHGGQDVFARCGTPIVAARGGVVEINTFQGRAGYYIVVRGERTNVRYVYMHLQQRGRVPEGARVRTGQRIGFNGQTGNASGCHLHFEMWQGEFWRGSRMNPTPLLRRWRRWS